MPEKYPAARHLQGKLSVEGCQPVIAMVIAILQQQKPARWSGLWQTLVVGVDQAEAAALVDRPFSSKKSFSSPAWNISRRMSEPPTNSPLT